MVVWGRFKIVVVEASFIEIGSSFHLKQKSRMTSDLFTEPFLQPGTEKLLELLRLLSADRQT